MNKGEGLGLLNEDTLHSCRISVFSLFETFIDIVDKKLI